MEICNNNIHNELIAINQDKCPFCEKLLIHGNNELDKCCLDCKIEDINGIYTCISCGLVNGVVYKSAFFDFYENMYKIIRKSIYIRKYHIENLINNLLVNQGVELTHKQRTKIYKIFELIGFVTNQINENRKRIISVKYLLQRIFDMMDIKYNIPITKSKRTLNFYNAYWEKIMTLVGDQIHSITNQKRDYKCYLLKA